MSIRSQHILQCASWPGGFAVQYLHGTAVGNDRKEARQSVRHLVLNPQEQGPTRNFHYTSLGVMAWSCGFCQELVPNEM